MTAPLLEVEVIGDVTVVRFTRRTILEPDAIERVGDQLRALVRGGARKLALDLTHVESLTSAMLGKFVAVHKEVEESGRLVFCNVDPFLKHIFTICGLPAQIPLLPDLPAALDALGAAPSAQAGAPNG